MPFFTAQELEIFKQIKIDAVPRFWSAVCIWQEKNADGLMEFKFKKLDKLTIEEPEG